MRIYKHSYTESGEHRETKNFYIAFKDHQGRPRRLPAFTDRKASETLGHNIEHLVALRAASEPLDPPTGKWIESAAPALRKRLMKFGLLEAARLASLEELMAHLEGRKDAQGRLVLVGFRQDLEARATTAQYAALTVNRVKRVLQGCKFVFWSDIRPSKVMVFLSDLRRDQAEAEGHVHRGISAQSFNFYLTAFKSFCRWMVKDGRASESPVQFLDGLNVRTDRRHDRRALTVKELRTLLDNTRRGPARLGMSGAERAGLYRLAVETGLRAGELASLTAESFSLAGDRPTVTVKAAFSKHRREDVLPLRLETAEDLRLVLRNKLPLAPVFNLALGHTARMFREDLEAARAAWIAEGETAEERTQREGSRFLSYVDSQGRYADFHALRHTAATLLANSGTHPRTAQSLMRHSTMELTMTTYTHTVMESERAAVERLPDLGAPEKDIAAATGTDDERVRENLVANLVQNGGPGRTDSDLAGFSADSQKASESPTEPGKRISKRRVRDSNPRGSEEPNGFQDRRHRPLGQPSVSPELSAVYAVASRFKRWRVWGP